MTSITPLRDQKDPTAAEKLLDQFSLPRGCTLKMEISAVLTLQDQEDSYVRLFQWIHLTPSEWAK
jgi:hypothetical protein